MKIAYLTSTYPSVSHTFIRRELGELERQVGSIERFAIRHTPYAIVDPDDAAEDGITFRALAQPVSRWLRAFLSAGVRQPLALARGLVLSLRLAHRGHRGWVRHVAYWLEAVLLLDEMAARGVEHVHVHFGTNPTNVALIIRVMGGPPYSFTVHGPDEFDEPLGFSLGSKIESSEFVVAISSYCAAQLRRWVSYQHWDKIRLVHCAVGEEFFGAAQPVDPGSNVLVCVGRLSAQKGQLLLIDAFADALSEGLDASLVLVGDGELREPIEAAAARRGISGRVRITGWCSGAQVRQELLASRGLVLPSFAEGLPMVIMEAFALGRPVLSTYVAGIPELVQPGQNGWLVPAGSRELLTQAIASMLQAPAAELDRMAAHGRELVRRLHYTPTEAAKLAAHILHPEKPLPSSQRLSPTPQRQANGQLSPAKATARL